MADGLETSGRPALVLDEAGRMAYKTKSLRAYLGSHFRVTDGYLRGADVASDASFRELTKWSQGVVIAKPASFITKRAGDSHPLVVMPVVRLVDRAVERGTTSIVAFVDLSRSPTPPIQDLRDLFGLTASEATVAGEIARGMTVVEIAEARRVSVATVRSQLKGIFRKLDIKRQPEIIRIVDRIAWPTTPPA